MNVIIEWIQKYSAPVVILLACGAALIFLLQQVVEKSVESEFEKRNKRIELLLTRRSNFEEKVLLDQYNTVIDLQSRIGKIGADLNRLRHGIKVESFMKGNEIVPLTEIYLELQSKQFLLKEEFYEILQNEADNLLALANAKKPEEIERLGRNFLDLNTKFKDRMNHAFGINQINWNTLEIMQEKTATKARHSDAADRHAS